MKHSSPKRRSSARKREPKIEIQGSGNITGDVNIQITSGLPGMALELIQRVADLERAVQELRSHQT